VDHDEDWQQFWKALGIVIGVVFTILGASMCAAVVRASCYGEPCADVRLPLVYIDHGDVMVASSADRLHVTAPERGALLAYAEAGPIVVQVDAALGEVVEIHEWSETWQRVTLTRVGAAVWLPVVAR
jgi:hypothetical protein